MADIKQKFPVTSTVDLTITLASLATNAQGVYVAGRASTAVDNSTNNDLDHLVSGVIRVGTTPTASRQINIYAYAPQSVASGTPTYPDGITGTDAAKTMTSANVMQGALRFVASIMVDSNTDRDYAFAPVSISSLFGAMPRFWGLFVAHDTAVALNATGGNFKIGYERIQAQTV